MVVDAAATAVVAVSAAAVGRRRRRRRELTHQPAKHTLKTHATLVGHKRVVWSCVDGVVNYPPTQA